MQWTFKKDYRLLLFPATIFMVLLALSFSGFYRLSFNIMMLFWGFFLLVYFYRLHVKKDLQSSLHCLRFHDDCFQVLDHGEWLKVELGRSSLVSSWLLALQWKVTNQERPFLRKSFSLVVLPSSMEPSEFRALIRLLQ